MRYNGLWFGSSTIEDGGVELDQSYPVLGALFQFIFKLEMCDLCVSYTFNNQNYGKPSCEKTQGDETFCIFSVTTQHNILVSRPYVNAFFEKLPLASISAAFKAGILQTPGKINHEIVKIKM